MLVSSFNLLDSKAFKLTNGAYAATRMNSIGDLGCYGSYRDATDVCLLHIQKCFIKLPNKKN